MEGSAADMGFFEVALLMEVRVVTHAYVVLVWMNTNCWV